MSKQSDAHKALDFLSDRIYHQVFDDGSSGADHIETIRAALVPRRGITRYVCVGGVGMVADTEGQWVHIKDLGGTEWALDPLISLDHEPGASVEYVPRDENRRR